MAFSFELVDFGSIDRVAGKLEHMKKNAEYTRTVMNLIYLDMLKVEESLIHSQGRRGGGAWKALKEETIKKKGNTRILYTSGASEIYSSLGGDTLVKSLTEEDAPYQIKEIDNTNVLFGTSRPYAMVHQRGSTRRKIPARPFLRFTPNDMNRWSKMIENHLVRGFND